jgi:thiol:disulfide interchange protein DsbA
MQRRDFSLTLGSLAAGALVLKPSGVFAQAAAPRAGTDYTQLDKPVPTDAPTGKIEVIEFFWYNCPHCNAFEPTLAAWVKTLPKDVVFRRVPTAFRDDFVPQQKLFYALEAMGLVDKLHARVFAAIHVEKQNLGTVDAITNWVVKQGVDKTKFSEQFNSFSVNTKANRARQTQDAYQIEGVPALGVAGRFSTDGAMAKSMERALKVVDYLVAQSRHMIT